MVAKTFTFTLTVKKVFGNLIYDLRKLLSSYLYQIIYNIIHLILLFIIIVNIKLNILIEFALFSIVSDQYNELNLFYYCSISNSI